MDFRSILDAALDVAIERLSRSNVNRQVFIFGPDGQPFWAKERVLAGELEWLRRAITILEKHEASHPRPFVMTPPGLPLTVMALDAEGQLYAVVLSTSRNASEEQKASRNALPVDPWLRSSRSSRS
jgi:hypothetical protein